MKEGKQVTMDLDALRQALMDYYGTAASPLARTELIRVEHADEEEFVEMARELGWL